MFSAIAFTFTFFQCPHSCELFMEKLGLLGQLQQNLWRRGEIYSFVIVV